MNNKGSTYSLRDLFAAHALPVCLQTAVEISKGLNNSRSVNKIASTLAYEIADSMLIIREKGRP